MYSGGSKDVRRAIGISPRGVRCLKSCTSWQSGSLKMQGGPNLRLFFYFLLSCTKGDLFVTLTGEVGFVLGITLQLNRNRFESPSLQDSENLTEQRQRRFN